MSSHVHPISRKRKEREAMRIEPAVGAPAPAGNLLLAGYLAHEFLTKGTLLGKQWPPDRSDSAGRSGRTGPVEGGLAHANRAGKAYDEMAYLLKTDGIHIPGVVNPTQLSRWIQM